MRSYAPMPDQARHLLEGIGAKAGVIDIGPGFTRVTFKSRAITNTVVRQPHQGAETGSAA